MDNFFKRLKKHSASQIEIDSKLDELLNKIDCLQISEARSRQDMRQIIREELWNILTQNQQRNSNKKSLLEIA